MPQQNNSIRNQLSFYLALYHAPGIGPKKFSAIYNHFSDLKLLFDLPKKELLHLGISKEIVNYLKNPRWQAVDNDLQWQEQQNNSILTWDCPEYPEQLKHIPSTPPVLYLRGNRNLLTNQQLAIVGSRNPSPNGIDIAYDFAKNLSFAGLTITSGLALGIDIASHKACLDINMPTIAVMGAGLNHIYPRRHSKYADKISENGAIISELPCNTPPIAENFPRRNRIISGLSLGVLVVEAALRSGSLITARFALEQGREVFALPGAIYNPLAKGCNELLRQGAKLVESIQDITEELLPQLCLQPSRSSGILYNSYTEVLDKDHAKLVECLSFETTPIDSLIVQSGIPADKVTPILLQMELQGLIKKVPGGYQKVRNKLSRD